MDRFAFISDLDGTLLQRNGIIDPENLQLLQELGLKSVTRVIATGRHLNSAFKVLEKDFPIDFLIFSSGAGIYDWKKQYIMRSYSLDSLQINSALTLMNSNNFDYMLHLPIPDNHRFYYKVHTENNRDFFQRLDRYREYAIPYSDKVLNTLEEACHIVIIFPIEKAVRQFEYIKDSLPQLNVIRATSPIDGKSTWVEIYPPTVSKSNACSFLCKDLGINPEFVMAVGNDYNDHDLLSWASNSFVVANAPDELCNSFNVIESVFKKQVKNWLPEW